MIRDIDFDTSPAHAGERRSLVVDGDGTISVAVKCFVEPPHPPRLRACAECGRVQGYSGQAFDIQVSPTTFAGKPGYLEIEVRDGTGDSRAFRLKVETDEGAPMSVTVTSSAS